MAIQIITSSLPSGVIGTAYSQTVQTFGNDGSITFAVASGSLPAGLSLNTSTGVISGTPTTANTYTFSISAEDDSDTATQAYSVRIYAALNTSPDPVSPATSVIVEAGQQVDFGSTGGSGDYLWSVNGGNRINPLTGLFTAVNGGNWTVTLTDQQSGQVATIAVTVTSQSQFCVTGEAVVDEIDSGGDACCEFNVECGTSLNLKIPSFHIVADGRKEAVLYGNLVQAVTGEAGRLRTTAGIAGATGNEVSFNRDAYFEIITTEDMADAANGEFGIGFSTVDADATITSIEHAVVWFTDGSDRKVELRHSGGVEASSQFDIAEGDAVTFGVIGGELKLLINSIEQFTSAETFAACGNVMLDIGIEESGKVIGGYVDNLTWEIVTDGTAAEVGAIDADGVYSSPSSPISGVIQVMGTVGTANFYVNIRNIQPTPRYTSPNAFLAGRPAEVWVTNKKATDNEIIRLASDGSPDALQNPGMINLGTLEGSATFAEAIEYQDFDNDEGTYFQSVASEKASLTGTYLEVRDLDKLALLMQHATLHPTVKGVKEISVGGKQCGSCDLRVVLVVASGACGSGWDVIYLPRVQNAANLNLEIGRKTNAKYELSFKVLPDPTRPRGKQLYSIYQMESCSSAEGATTCE